jgi:NAD(P)-dependent dehydrogenase (short-subunit alcohol dehydrogenase family)
MAVVLITGCSSGFGRAAALGFADRGDTVVATMRDPARAGDLGDHAGVHVDQLDVTEAESRAGVVARTLERHGRIDVLVNNAGISSLGPTEEMAPAIVDAMFRTNLFGPFELMRAVLPSMREAGGGRIVNVTSIGAVLTPGFYGWYCATKHGLDAVSAALDIELQRFAIRVSTVVPGGFGTAIAANLLDSIAPDTLYPRAAEAIAEWEQRIAAVPDLSPVTEAIIRAATDDPPRSRYLVGTGSAERAIPIVDAGEAIHAQLRARDA